MKRFLLFILLWLLSSIMFLYPGTTTYLHNRALANQGEAFITESAHVDEAAYSEAVEYNKTLNSYPIVDPWISDLRRTSDRYAYYLELLKGYNGQMGLIDIPKLNQRLPIFHDSNDALEKGVQHLYGTSLPIGGQSTMSVLTGHTGLPNMTVFDNIPSLVPGDTLTVYAGGHETVYSVKSHKIVEPTEIDAVTVEDGKDILVLITCTPYGINSHRYILIAERVPDEEVTEAVKEFTPAFQFSSLPLPMRIMFIAGVFIFIIGAVYIVKDFRYLRKRRRQLDSDRGDGEQPQIFEDKAAQTAVTDKIEP